VDHLRNRRCLFLSRSDVLGWQNRAIGQAKP
jgi:hypothetical protein